MKTVRSFILGAALALSATIWLGAGAQEMKMGGQAMPGHNMVTPDAIAWTDGPGSLPKGAQMAVLKGDPTKEGLFTMRIKVPANYKIAPHWHPADEHVTVISGTFYMGPGETFDEAKLKMIPAGGFSMMTAGTRHYARTGNTETIVQLHGMGPWGINYVNPADDPRK